MNFNYQEFKEKYESLQVEWLAGRMSKDEVFLSLGANVAEYYDVSNDNKPVCRECVCACSMRTYLPDESNTDVPNADQTIFPAIMNGRKHACWSCMEGLEETYAASLELTK